MDRRRRYTATVTSISEGWSYTQVQGSRADTTADVLLAAPLVYGWGFEDDVVPAHLNPFVANVNLLVRDAASVPDIAKGDLLAIDVRVGTAGDRIIAPQAMRVTDVRATVRSRRQRYAVLVAIALVDLSVDWVNLQPGPTLSDPFTSTGYARSLWRERLAEIANRIGVTVGCPTTWVDGESPLDPGSGPLYPIFTPFQGNAKDNLDALLNSHQPSSLAHTWATIYAPAGHPTGYRRVGPDTWSFSGGVAAPITEPVTDVKIEAVPADRTTATLLDIDASWCDLPTTARRSREGAVNRVGVEGQAQSYTSTGGYDTGDWTYNVDDAADIAARGLSVREVPTQLDLPATNFARVGDATRAANATAVAGHFLSDPDDSWALDGFQLKASRIPQATAETLLPVIAPRLPGETDGDGALLRHVTIDNLPDEFEFVPGDPMVGFVAGGSLTIQGGDITFDLRLVPGTV